MQVAEALHAPLDVLVVRKIGAPSHPEYGIGAIAEGGHYILDKRAASAVGATAGEIEAVIR